MWMVILIIFVVIVVIVWGGILLSAPGRREVQKLTINVIDFQKLRDGTYVGEYIGTKDHSRDTKVQASISEGQILDIKIFKGALDKNGNPLKMKGG